MPITLPTDTAHVSVQTRQYELFGKRLGQGIPRLTLGLALLVGGLWFVLLLVLGVSPLARLGPMVFGVPPFVVVFFGSRRGDDGRISVLRWYDAVLWRLPGRRRVLGNPLLPSRRREPGVLHLHVVAELDAGCPDAEL